MLPLPLGIGAEEELREFTALRAHTRWSRLPFSVLVFWLYRRDLIVLLLLTTPFLFSTLGSPLILRALIQTLQGNTELWMHAPFSYGLAFGIDGVASRAVICAVLLFFCTLINVFLIHHIFYRQLLTSLRVKLLLTGVIYRKSLCLSREALQRLGAGFVVNLVAIDVFKISNLWMLMHSVWFHPLVILGVMLVLYQMVGETAMIGFVAMILALGCSALCTRLQSRLKARLVKINDRRVSLINEVLVNIRGVKISSREQDLSARVGELREMEVGLNRQITFLLSVSTFASASSPVIAMGAMFLPIVLGGGQLAPATVFPSLALLIGLRFALLILPDTFLLLAETRIALRRIQSFLSESEAQSLEQRKDVPTGTISLHGVTFSWKQGSPAIAIDELVVQPGELIAVIGEVGSGKSALLLGMLNELNRSAGDVRVQGDVAYVAQQPWLVSDTIMRNILCERELDLERYQRAVSMSQLEYDLAGFPGGDQVEIGERGIALSGGQRQRLALARAFYRDADIVLLDDPLSALDGEVANSVFSDLVLTAWQKKTRILVTHRLEFALKADRVLLIEGGSIVADGSPQEIMERNQGAKALFKAHHESVTAHAGSRAKSDIIPHDEARAQNAVQTTVSTEDREIGAVQGKVIREYLALFAPGAVLLALLGLFVLRQALSVGLDLYWAFSAGGDSGDSASFLLGFLLLSILVCLMNFMRAYFILSRGLIAGRNAHGKLLRGVLAAPMRFFESNPVGRILNRFSRDLDTVDSSVPRSILDLLICAFDVVTTVSIVIILQPWGALVVVPVLLVYFYLQKIFRPTSREVQRLESVTRSPVFALLSESLRGVETLRAFGVVMPFARRFSETLNLNGRAFMSMVASNRWLGIRLEILGSFITLTAALGVCFFRHDPLGAAISGFALAYAMSITSSMNWLVRMVAQTESNLTSFERIDFYANLEQERWQGKTPAPEWPERGEIELENVSVRYRPELPLVLTQVSAHITPGERIGIIGRSGSGKTTLTQALFRLLELDSGKIRIDGEDLATLPLANVRRALTMIPQEPVLFSGTIRSHLDPSGKFSDDELFEALERVELSETVIRLPQQLLTQVSEGGQNFSAGQRQLLCLAHALLKKSKVIILDEATAHVDPKSDLAIQRTIRQEFRGATQLIIAHRLGTVMDCDRIFVFGRGSIVKIVTPEQLRSLNAEELIE